MKRKALIIGLAAVALLSGCTSSNFSAVATGSSLGGMFGSSIGGLFGGPRGHDVGTVVGMLAGGAIGAAVSAERSENGETDYIDVRNYDDYSHRRSGHSDSQAYHSPWNALEVTNVRLVDANDNSRLDPGEHVRVTMDIYNRGNDMLYDIAPIVTCDNRRVAISPTAIVSELAPGRGFRYKVEIIAPARLKGDRVTFNVAFGEKRRQITAKRFSLRTGH